MEVFRPSVRLGKPEEEYETEYKKVVVNDHVSLYLHESILNLDESYKPKIDVEWKLFGKGLVIKGI